MRQVSDEQRYLDFTAETSLKVVEQYRRKYGWINEVLESNDLILWTVHEYRWVNHLSRFHSLRSYE